MAVSSKDNGIHPALFSAEFQRNPFPTYRHHMAGPPLQPLVGRPGSSSARIIMRPKGLCGKETCNANQTVDRRPARRG